MRIPTVIRTHKLATALSILLALPVLVFLLWSTISLHYTFSSGTRAGLLQKFSRRGWICKTWEGELQTTAVPGSVPEKFYFSTRSDSMAGVLERLSGQQVVLTYDQHVGVPGSCFGDTEYFITAARKVQ